MPVVQIEDAGCRGCALCVDNCPVEVFAQQRDPDTGAAMAKVVRAGDCMGCFACYYLCPSQCISIAEVDLQRPFYRVDENTALVERFLQAGSTTAALTDADWDEAYRDVAMTLVSLSRAIESVLGRGILALGRRAGTLAAPHFPEVFEVDDLPGRLQRLQHRLRGGFDFEFEIHDGRIRFTFAPCGLCGVVRNEAGEQVGEAVLCRLFHDFLAGLIGVYAGGTNYRHEIPRAGAQCEVVLSPI